MININALYIMILTSPKSIRQILNGYDTTLPFSEIHCALQHIGITITDKNDSLSILGENIEFLRNHLI